MKRILTSLFVIGLVAALGIGASRAFFSDTETSTGNKLTAGSINLSLGSQYSSFNDNNGDGRVFALAGNNNGRALYNFSDLKPGDWGTVSFELSVSTNDAYACAMSSLESTPENGLIDPESEAGDSTTGANGGELQNYVQFALFHDVNRNGQWDSGEPINHNQDGDGDGFTVQEVVDTGWIGVADYSAPNTWLAPNGILEAETPYNAGFLYCFGGFANVNTTVGTFECNASTGDYDDAQTDQIVGAIEFTAVQTRSNEGFLCSSLNNGGSEESIPSVLGTGWSTHDSAQDFFAKARANNTTNFELALGNNDALPAGQDTADSTFANNTDYPFTVVLDNFGNASFTINEETTNFSVGAGFAAGAQGRIGINAKATEAGRRTTVKDLMLNSTPLTVDMVEATNEHEHLLVTGQSFVGGFTLSGILNVDWANNTSPNEKTAMQIIFD